MVDKISVEIDLEGGAEVEKQLADIGKTGQQALSDIQGAADQLNLDSATAQFDDLSSAGQAAFQKVKSAAQNAVIAENVIQGVAKIEGAFESLGNAATKMAARLTRGLGPIGVFARALGPLGIALGVVGGAFLKFGDDAADGINKLTAAGAQLGETPQQLDKLQKALGQVGIDPGAITAGLAKLKEALSQDFFPQDLTTGLQNFIAQLAAMPDSVERTQLAMQKFGDGGAQLIAALRAGTLSADTFKQTLAGVSPVTQQQIDDAAKYQVALGQLKSAWDDLRTAFQPITTPIFNFLTDQIRQFIEDLKTLRLEFALAKAAWDVFVAGLKGQDIGEAARKAVEDYRKLEQQLKATGASVPTKDVAALGTATTNTGNAAQKANEQMMRGADGVLRANETVSESWERRKAEQQAAMAAQAAADAQAAASSEQARAARERARAAAEQAAAQQQAAAEAATAASQAIARAAINAALGFEALGNSTTTATASMGNFLIVTQHGIVLLQGFTEAAARAAQFIANLQRPTSIPPLWQSRPEPIGPGFASGGLLGGHGTGTSDSNLAWVSRGEHIMPARAVAQPGVLAFLEALRRSGGNLRGVLDGLGRFALGGLVPRSLPAFAAGGAVGGMNHVTIQFPGLPPVGGLRASPGAVNELRHAAAMAQVSSGGRKPSRYS